MKQPFTILLDCDGVLSDFVGSYLSLVYAVTGRRYTPADVTHARIADGLGLTREEVDKVHDMLNNERGFARSLDVYPGAEAAVAKLKTLGELYIVTSPWWTNTWWCTERIRWLDLWFGIGADHVILTSAKHLVTGNVFVDDSAKNVRAWAETRYAAGDDNFTPLLWRTPHNTSEGWPDTVTSWDDLIARVDNARTLAAS